MTRNKMKERLAALTTIGDHPNAWPDLAELVSVTKVPKPDPKMPAWEFTNACEAYYQAGIIEGQATGYRNIRVDTIPGGLDGKPGAQYVGVLFAHAKTKGQVDSEDTRNLVGLVRGGWGGPHYIIELGCNHEYDVRKQGRCFRVATCSKCDHHWECDSGD